VDASCVKRRHPVPTKVKVLVKDKLAGFGPAHGRRADLNPKGEVG
jgi:hypothetical protein